MTSPIYGITGQIIQIPIPGLTIARQHAQDLVQDEGELLAHALIVRVRGEPSCEEAGDLVFEVPEIKVGSNERHQLYVRATYRCQAAAARETRRHQVP